MKRCLLTLCAVLVMAMPVFAQDDETTPPAQSDAPYLYYYSEALNGVVIERADGTDSRIIGQGLVDEDVLFVYGPGWSADGRWFAWQVHIDRGTRWWATDIKGYVASADDQNSIDMMAYFDCVFSMLWHPTDNILLVYGTRTTDDECPQSPSPTATLWLIDVDNGKRLAAFSFDVDGDGELWPQVHWMPNNEQIQFFLPLIIDYDEYIYQDYLVTLSYDGSVTTEPVAWEEVEADSGGVSTRTIYDVGYFFTNWWFDQEEAERIDPPPNSSAVGGAVATLWDTSEEWVLVGYEWCTADCSYAPGRVSIFNPETGYIRELSNCRANWACIGWLPEQVDLANLPSGQPTSVLPAPELLEYEGTFGMGRLNRDVWYTHLLACNDDQYPPMMTFVRNTSTDEVELILPKGEACEQFVPRPQFSTFTQPVVFAASPDGRYYAITHQSELTILYDGETGETIATLNINGIDLSFSEDSRKLVTIAHYATATWDIESLVNGGN